MDKTGQQLRILYRKPEDCAVEVQINNLDYYQTSPTAFDRQTNPVDWSSRPLPSIPVIRIYGTTAHDQHVMVHIHGIFPYLYVEYTGSLVEYEVRNYIRKLNKAINDALILAYRRNKDSPNSVFVANIVLCKGVPFYGFHVGWVPYLKIYLLNPSHISKLSELLNTGSILGTKMQPYESHIPYILQFLTDFNLTGCGLLRLSAALFRGPLSSENIGLGSQSVLHADGLFHNKSVSPNLVLPIRYFPKMATCALEIDVDASQILNRENVVERNLHHDFSEAFTSKKNQEKNTSNGDKTNFESRYTGGIKYVNSLKEVWLDEYQRRHMEGGGTYTSPQDSISRIASSNECERWKLGCELEKEVRARVQQAHKEKNWGKTFQNFTIQRDYIFAVPKALKTVNVMFTPLELVLTRLEKLNMLPSEPNENKEFENMKEKYDNSDDEKIENLSENLEETAEKKIKGTKDKDDNPEHFKKKHLQNYDSKIETENVKDGGLTDSAAGFISELDSSDFSFSSFEFSLPEISKTKTSTRKRSAEPDFEESISKPKVLCSSTKNLVATSQYTIPQTFTFSQEQLSFNTASEKQNFSQILSVFPSSKKTLAFSLKPPTKSEVQASWKLFKLPTETSRKPFYGIPSDIPKHPVVFSGVEYNVKSNTAPFLPPFKFSSSLNLDEVANILNKTKPKITGKVLKYNVIPPSFSEVQKWLELETQEKANHQLLYSQVNGPTPKNKYGFKFATQKRNESRKINIATTKYLSSMTLELHISTRKDLHPDPNKDPVLALFWGYQSEYMSEDPVEGCIFVAKDIHEQKKIASILSKSLIVKFVSLEVDLIDELINTVLDYDPDILSGYEINSASWGYIIQRSRTKYEYDLCEMLSRVLDKANVKVGDRWGYTHASAIRISGRHMLNIWRVLRNELNLLKYTLENVAFHVLHYRIPFYTFESLTRWYDSTLVSETEITIKYHIQRLRVSMDLMDSQEIITRTCEEARIIGIDFYSVFYRGSQYKVESILTRIAKAENFIMISPSKKQVAEQNAIECIPLILEPKTNFYTSPIVVLDFQSLYPSVMIAYNYCYSTCLGRIHNWRGRNKLGVSDLKLPAGLLSLLQRENITIAPNGMMYVESNIRKSLLAKMLTEFLDTRVMVKHGMKTNKDNAAFQKLMNSRQLALKLIANVTYGYTSATYSGRMPCVEIADSIVQTGRETMERAIEHINANQSRWGADVIYGDTDSLFLHFDGRSKEEAFILGNEIANEITNMNPQPMKLKFEKVYWPCILQTKKRYVGYMWEYPDQKTPVFNAKGIETVRRDGIPAQQKIEEKALHILFDTCDLSKVKEYLLTEFTKIQSRKIPLSDLCFAKEVRLGSYRSRPPPGAILSKRRAIYDPYSAPQYRERVPYVVVSGPPGARISDRCMAPEDILASDGLFVPDVEYYITNVLIPPLERLLSLAGADVRRWYQEMPRKSGFDTALTRVSGIRGFVQNAACRSCGCKVISTNRDYITEMLCTRCRNNLGEVSAKLITRAKKREKKVKDLDSICQNCAKISPGVLVECISNDCPIYFARAKAASQHNDSLTYDWPLLTKINDW